MLDTRCTDSSSSKVQGACRYDTIVRAVHKSTVWHEETRRTVWQQNNDDDISYIWYIYIIPSTRMIPIPRGGQVGKKALKPLIVFSKDLSYSIYLFFPEPPYWLPQLIEGGPLNAKPRLNPKIVGELPLSCAGRALCEDRGLYVNTW